MDEAKRSIGWSDVAVHLNGFAHLATVRPDGGPHVAKVAPAVEGDTIWIATRTTSAKARNIAGHPQVAVMFEPGAEVYVQADAELVHDLATKRRVWTSGLFPFPLEGFFGSFDDAGFVLVRLRPMSAIVMTQGPTGPQRQKWTA
jgi:general stress protein 26